MEWVTKNAINSDDKDVLDEMAGKLARIGITTPTYLRSNQNYKNATQAADRRIATLQNYKDKKGCDSNTKQIKAKTASIVEELNELNAMYKAGDITKSEFEAAKRNLLNN